MTAVIFDLDGTLIHSAPDIHAATAEVLAAAGYEPLSYETIKSFIGNGIEVLVSRIRAHIGIPQTEQADLVAAVLEVYEYRPAGLTTVYPGVPEALDRLASAGLRLGICTNKPEGPARRVLAHLDLDRHFSVVVGGDTLPQRKPDPAPLLHTMARLGASTAQFVGDSEVDAATAAAAGVRFALFSEGYRLGPLDSIPHHASFSHFDSLPGLLGA